MVSACFPADARKGHTYQKMRGPKHGGASILAEAVTRLLLAVLVFPFGLAAAAAGRSLEIYFIDVEGGASTLLVTPAGESVLIDTGYGQREGRDPGRVMAAMRAAGVDRLDIFVATHLHNDHVGGLPELAAQVPHRHDRGLRRTARHRPDGQQRDPRLSPGP